MPQRDAIWHLLLRSAATLVVAASVFPSSSAAQSVLETVGAWTDVRRVTVAR